ncbi:MAG TPA: acylneuraminate cytidylyltransferase family protein [Gemmatimonadales bacterium]|nr:acylneuraminate cytidylyltransferase family protein [Gemmatimonadales bacterium]
MNILVDIPARGGSKGIPRKNLRTLLGISLVGWAVLAARRSRVLLGTSAALRILVDTDDEEIAREGRAWGAEVPFLRPAELARDESPTAGSVVHAVARYRESGWAPDGVILLQPTSPLRSAEDVVACATPFLAGASESVVSVSPLEHPLELAYRRGEAGVLTRVMPGSGGAIRRQDGTPAVFPSGAVYVLRAALLSSSERFIHEGATLGIELPKSRSLDIDTEADLALAESVARGEALAARLEAVNAVGRWHEVDLGSLSAGFAGFEEMVGAGGAVGLRVTAPRSWSEARIFDGVAACRRATGLPAVAATS